MAVGQVFYTPWCDEHGKVIDDGTVSRLSEQTFRWTAADPSLRWFRQNAAGFDVAIEDISEDVAALALQGPTSARLLRAVSDVDIDRLKYFRVASGTIAGVPRRHLAHRLHRRSRLRDLDAGAARASTVWDALMEARQARSTSSRAACWRSTSRASRRAAADRRRFLQQQEGDDRVADVLAVRDGAGPAGQPRQGPLHRPAGAARGAARAGPRGRSSASEIDWTEVEAIYETLGLAPAVGATASRVAVPVYRDGRQVGKATSTTWSPVLKRMIALATVDRPHYAEGTEAADRDDGRGRPPPRRRDGREDAVLQPAAEDGDAAGVRRSTIPAMSPSSAGSQTHLDGSSRPRPY